MTFKKRTALDNGKGESSAFMGDISVKIVKRRSLNQLGKTLLNSTSHSKTRLRPCTETRHGERKKKERKRSCDYSCELSLSLSHRLLTLSQAAADLDLELDEVLAGVEGEEGDVLVADDGQHVGLPLQGEAGLQPVVALQREGGLHLAPSP